MKCETFCRILRLCGSSFGGLVVASKFSLVGIDVVSGDGHSKVGVGPHHVRRDHRVRRRGRRQQEHLGGGGGQQAQHEDHREISTTPTDSALSEQMRHHLCSSA